MTNKQFFQEALLEAKAIRETALVAAKEALEEAFTPKIKSMIDAKLSLMEDDASDDNEMTEKKDVDEAKAKASGQPLLQEFRSAGIPAVDFSPNKGNDKFTMTIEIEGDIDTEPAS